MCRLGDDHAAIHAHHTHRLLQHHLHLSRVALPPLSVRNRLWSWSDAGEINDRPLRLGDDLLRDADDVIGAEWPKGAFADEALDGFCDELWKVVVRLDLTEPINRKCDQAIVISARLRSRDGVQVFWSVKICGEQRVELLHAAVDRREFAQV